MSSLKPSEMPAMEIHKLVNPLEPDDDPSKSSRMMTFPCVTQLGNSVPACSV